MTASPLEEEVGKLLAAFQHWLAANARTVHVATGSAECCVCPLCQLIALARSARPDLVERLSATAGEAFAAFRSLVDNAQAAGPETHSEPPASSFRRIDVDE